MTILRPPKKGVLNAINFAPGGGLHGERLQAVCYSKPPLATCAADLTLASDAIVMCNFGSNVVRSLKLD